jgi:phospholipid transport system substrate-binding protein
MNILNTGKLIRPRTATLLAAVLAAALSAVSAVAETSEHAQLVESTAGQILSEIDARRAEFQKDPDALSAMVRAQLIPLLDNEYSARLILGRQGRDLPAEKVTRFADALSNVLTDRYSTGLLNFRSKDQLEILPGTDKDSERLTRVRTRIQLESGGSVPVDYAFRKTPEGWKVFDVTVEGISYVLTFRNQLAPKVAAEGIDQVTDGLLSGKIDVNET